MRNRRYNSKMDFDVLESVARLTNISGFRFTGRKYRCPKCGTEIDGYIEDESEGEWAGCHNCLDCWKAEELKQTNKEKVEWI